MTRDLTIDELIIKLDESVSQESVENALKKACALVVRDAKKLAPVGDTGELRRSISYEVNNKVGTIGTNLEYAPYVEFGTGIHAANGDGRTDVPWVYYDERKKQFFTTDGMEPHPFLYPALDSNVENINKIFAKQIMEALNGR